MEEAAVPPMVAAVLVDSNGADNAVLDKAIPSESLVEEKEHIDGDVANMTMIASAGDSNGEEPNAGSVKDGGRMAMECSTPTSGSPSTRKKRGAFSLFKAVFMFLGRSDSIKKADCATSPRKKTAIVAADDDKPGAGDWKSLIDGMRPLRLRGRDLEYYPPPPPLGHTTDVYHDVMLPPPSPARSGFEEAGMTSRYASAQDLQQMDTDEEEDAPAAESGDSGCPHAIDMQAEEFIAKFYEQFTSESFNGPASE